MRRTVDHDPAPAQKQGIQGVRTPATMMALRAHARGGAEQLVFEQAPVPAPGPGEALVEVHAAGITFAGPHPPGKTVLLVR